MDRTLRDKIEELRQEYKMSEIVEAVEEVAKGMGSYSFGKNGDPYFFDACESLDDAARKLQYIKQ